jgi:hypothetical protein
MRVKLTRVVLACRRTRAILALISSRCSGVSSETDPHTASASGRAAGLCDVDGVGMVGVGPDEGRRSFR